MKNSLKFLVFSIALSVNVVAIGQNTVLVNGGSGVQELIDKFYKEEAIRDSLSQVKSVVDQKYLQYSIDSTMVVQHDTTFLEKRVLKYLDYSPDSCNPPTTFNWSKESPFVLNKINQGKRVLAEQVKVINAERKSVDKQSILLRDSIRKQFVTQNGAYELFFERCLVKLYVVNFLEEDVNLHIRFPGGKPIGSFGNLVKYLTDSKQQVLMVTNAGMFTPSYAPEGLYVEREKKYSWPIDTNFTNNGENFFLQPNGVFYLDSNSRPVICSTRQFVDSNLDPHKLTLATQSGPMLICNGKIHPSFNRASSNKKIRSGVGVMPNGQVVFMCSQDPINFYNFAMLFRNFFDADNALFLDGAISMMDFPRRPDYHSDYQFGPLISITTKKPRK